MATTWKLKGGIWTCTVCGTEISGHMPLYCKCAPLSGESPTVLKLKAEIAELQKVKELAIEMAQAAGYELASGGWRPVFDNRLNLLLPRGAA